MYEIIKIAYKSTKNNYKDYKLFIANNIIAFVSTFLLWNIFLYLYQLYENEMVSFSMIRMIGSMCIALSAVAIVFIYYAIKRFTITRAYEYSILLNLGIKKKHFNLFILAEYGGILILSLISGLVLGNFFTQIFFSFMKYLDLFIDKYRGSLIGINLWIIMIYLLIVLSSFCTFLYFQHRVGKVQYFERLGKNGSFSNKITILSVMGFLVGLALEIYFIILLSDFTVGKLFISMVINIVGVFFLLKNIRILKTIIVKCLPKLYYKNLVKWNHVFNKFEQNRNIIWGVYIINFIGPFVVAGLLTTFILDDTNYDELYPYDMVYIRDESRIFDFFKLNNGSNIQEVDFLEGKYKQSKLICISAADYNRINDSNIQLEEGEIIFYGQRRPEEFAVVEDKKIDIIIGDNEKLYHLVDADWKIVFGEKLSSQLENIVILNNIDFEQQKCKEKRILGLINYSSEISLARESTYIKNLNIYGTTIFSKQSIVFSNQTVNKFNTIIVCIIGVFILWECSCILYIKNYSDLKMLFYEKEIYELVGIKPKGIKNIFKGEMRTAYLLPVQISMCMSAICFIADCFYETNEVKTPLIVFGIIILFYEICQLLIYSISINSLMKKLNI